MSLGVVHQTTWNFSCFFIGSLNIPTLHPGSIVPYRTMLFLYCDRRICCAGGGQKPKQFSECLECSSFTGVLWLGLGTPQALRRDCTQCCGLNGAPRSTPTLTEVAWFQTYTHKNTHTADSVVWRCPRCKSTEYITKHRWIHILWASTLSKSFGNAYLIQSTLGWVSLQFTPQTFRWFGSVYSCLNCK